MWLIIKRNKNYTNYKVTHLYTNVMSYLEFLKKRYKVEKIDDNNYIIDGEIYLEIALADEL